MKLLAFIFSFYILLLSAVPCADTQTDKDITLTTVSPTAGHGHQHHREEACTPFCACACCGQVFTPSLKPYKITYNKPVLQKGWGFYINTSLCSNYPDTIWQPPRLS